MSDWRSTTFTKKSRKGKVLKVVREHYLRDDIGCSSGLCDLCPRSAPWLLSPCPPLGYLVLDTNVFLNQMDLLEQPCPALSNVIVLQTVMEEVKHQNLGLYNRLHALLKDEERCFVYFANEHHRETYVDRKVGESPNDRNDRAIRVGTAWYMKHLGGTMKVTLVTNDRENLQLALDAHVEATSIHALVQGLKAEYGTLVDILSTSGDDPDTESNSTGPKSRNKVNLFADHKPISALTDGVKCGRYFQGTIRCNRDHWLESYVLVRGKEGDRCAVLIKGRENINRAIDGDVVVIEMLPRAKWCRASDKFVPNEESEREDNANEEKQGGEDFVGMERELAGSSVTLSEETVELSAVEAFSRRGKGAGDETGVLREELSPCGRVVGVIKRSWRQVCGSLEVRNGAVHSERCLFAPVDKKFPKIWIRTTQRETLLDKRFLVTIDSWPRNSRFPLGHYVRTLGTIGDKDTETQVLLIEHDIPTAEFSAAVMACLPPVDWSITPENSIGRRDIRHLPVLSIDPPGCKDIDDALHAVELPNGNIQVGVHIADVTHFVSPDSALDREAADRCTSTYLVERRLDMLPGLLTETLCSLRGGVDRFAFSVVWEMTPNAEVVRVEFFKSIIHSIRAMSYGEAQLLLDDPSADSQEARSCKMLNALATILRQRRMDAGALTLASPEVRFVLDVETQNPLDVQLYSLKQANALVEEFMLLANITVAKKILRHFPNFSLLRRHPAPSRQQFDELLASSRAVGVEINVDSSKTLADSLDLAELPSPADGCNPNPYFNKLLRILTTRCMMPAQYLCSGEFSEPEFHHYGLAAPVYTHFTSPIRRYADVIVHRLLAAAIGVSPLPVSLQSKSALHDQSQQLNARHRSAQLAGRASVLLHTLIYFKERPTEEEAVVMRVKANGVVVMVPRFGIEGTVFLDRKSSCSNSTGNLTSGETAPELAYNEKEHTVTFAHAGSSVPVTLTVFDRVRVYIHVVTSVMDRPELRVALVTPIPVAPTNTASIDDNEKKRSRADQGGGKCKKLK